MLKCGFGDESHDRYAVMLASIDALDAQGRVVEVPYCDLHATPTDVGEYVVEDTRPLP